MLHACLGNTHTHTCACMHTRPETHTLSHLTHTQAMRQSDDDFAQAVYQTSRRAFARTLREALEAWDANHAAKVGESRLCPFGVQPAL
jgi:hypothetical protein